VARDHQPAGGQLAVGLAVGIIDGKIPASVDVQAEQGQGGISQRDRGHEAPPAE